MKLSDFPLETMDALDRDYVLGWQEECNARSKLGAYEYAMHLMDLKPGDIHVDLGAGFAQMPARLKRANPGSRVFAVESNVQMAAFAHHYFQAQNVPLHLIGDPHLEQRPDRFVRRYDIPENLNPAERLNPDAPLQMVVDDIRSLGVLKAILGDQAIDSGSFLFPGSSLRPLIEDAIDHAELQQIVNDPNYRVAKSGLHNHGLRKAAYQFFSERIKPGGTVVTAERAGLIPQDVDEAQEFIASAIFARLGEQGQYWEIYPGKIGYRDFTADGHSNSLGWADHHNRNINWASSRSGHIIIVGMTRNDVPYSTSKDE